MKNLANNIGLSMLTFTSRIVSGSVVYIILARLLSLNNFGLLSFGVTFAGLLTVMAEFGYSLMSQRDIPQKRFELNAYVFNTLTQKVVLSAIAIIGGLVYLNFFFSGDNTKIGVIFVANAIVTSNNMYLFSVFRAKNKFKIESWLSMIYSAIIILVILLFYLYNLDVFFIAYGLLFGRLVQLILLLFIYVKTYSFSFKFDKKIQIYLFKNSFSFGAHYIIGVFYFTVDSQLIAIYSGNKALAIYQAFFKIVLIFLSVSELLNNVLIPYLSSMYSMRSKEFVDTAKLTNRLTIILGLIIFVFINLFSKDMIAILYSEKYLSALLIVVPLSFVLFFRILSSVYSILLTISDHQNIRVLIVLISLLVNVSLNFIFIPKFGYVGAAYVSMVTHVILACLYILFVHKYIKSVLINWDIIVIGLVTVFLFLLYSLFKIELNFILSCLVMIAWMSMLIFLFKKEQRVKIKKLFLDGYL